MEAINHVLDALGETDYSSLTPVQKELLQRNVVRFILNLMPTNRGNRTKYLKILWQISATNFSESDKQRLDHCEPRATKLFAMAKFSHGQKYSILPIAEEINKYYHVHEGELPDFFLDIFKKTWDNDFLELKQLICSTNRNFEDLAFLFLMSLETEKLDKSFYQRMSKARIIYPELVGRAVVIAKFKEPDEELDPDDIKAFCRAHTFHNKQRPIVKFYASLVDRMTPEQKSSFIVSKILRNDYNCAQLISEFHH